MKCFVVVYQSLSEFYEARLFHRGGARRDEKDLFKKKKKTITSKTREQKKQRRDSRDFNTRDNNTLLRRETHF